MRRVMMAAACAARRSEAAHARRSIEFARAIGLAFQIQDDLLDVEGDATLLGKATGADRALDKPTYPSGRRRRSGAPAHARVACARIARCALRLLRPLRAAPLALA